MIHVVRTVLLFLVTAVAELVGCYLPYRWLRKEGSAWLLVPAGLSLAAFAWLLTLHPSASGRVYAGYGGVYVASAVLWLWAVDGVRPNRWDLLGVTVTLIGHGHHHVRSETRRGLTCQTNRTKIGSRFERLGAWVGISGCAPCPTAFAGRALAKPVAPTTILSGRERIMGRPGKSSSPLGRPRSLSEYSSQKSINPCCI